MDKEKIKKDTQEDIQVIRKFMYDERIKYKDEERLIQALESVLDTLETLMEIWIKKTS
jgi:hypothetical protein